MGLHKLTAGDGYSYLTRQVAAADSTERGASSLADYYSEKGESPGRWSGTGLAALETVSAGEQVAEAHMKALFGEGLHPNAEAMYAETFASEFAAGATKKAASREAEKVARLGRPFKIDSGATDYRIACAEAFVEHNLAAGEKWNAPIDPEERARIRTDIGAAMFRTEYGRAPADARELSGWVAKIGRQNTKAVAGYDLTFTPVKSVSALWAIAPREIAHQIETAHENAVAAAIEFLEKNATFSRTGTNGVAQVDTDGLIAAAFTHRDSRAGDPNLHTHVAISNKVRITAVDGTKRWLALDGQPLYRNTVTASEIYNTVLEAQVRERVGGRFAERPSADTRKRPVRELVGMSEELATAWSSRRTMIEARIGELSSQFQLDHGREPTAIEAISLAERATLETRAAKHEGRSFAEQRAQWRGEAIGVLGSEEAVAQLVAGVTTPHQVQAAERSPEWVAETADGVLEVVSASRARWQLSHLRAEAVRAVRGAEVPETMIGPLVQRIVDAASDPARSIDLGRRGSDVDPALVPAPMRRRDGTDVHTRHETTLFTTAAILDAETRIVTSAQRGGGRRIDTGHVDMALLESVANGTELNAGQAALVREMATSGARVQLALAPAGTGKTTAMRTLARAWANSGGHVIGFAPTAAAAGELRAAIDTDTDTLAKLLDEVGAEKTGALLRRWKASPRARRRDVRSGELTERHRELAELVAAGEQVNLGAPAPAWFDKIGPDTLVLVDEAGMTGTLDLDAAIAAILARGASVRLIGDDQQLASISAGGVLRDIHDTVGALTLSNVVRFSDPSEGAASLALRDGDDAAIAFYIDHGRVHVGSESTVADDAYTAWAADRDAGRDAVLLAPTREVVNTLNARARTDRLAALDRDPDGAPRERERETTLSDGLAASAGDIVCTRKNDRRLPITATDWVRNGDRWSVESVGEDGELVVRHLGLGRTITLPADYVVEHVTLGYASTIHTAQGMTADDCHVVATGAETRQLAYVALTRGRHGNHLYLPTASDGDLHLAMTERGLLPPTAVDDFRQILRRDGAQKSALTTMRELDDPAANLGHAAQAYDDAVGAAAEAHLGPEAMAALDASADELHPGLTDAPAWPVLRRHLATIQVGGADAVQALAGAIASRELDTADDAAAVLDWRLDPTGNHSVGRGPLPWLPGIPSALATDEAWGPYLHARRDVVTDHADAVRAVAGTWTPATSPVWARPFVGGEDTTLVAELAVFRAAREIDDADRRPAGPDEYAIAPRRAQKRLRARAAAVVGDLDAAVRQWEPLVDEIDRHIAQDPYWPELADRFGVAARAGMNVHALVREAAATSPLPDELPAAALWWRLSGTLSAAAVDADGSAASLRPVWTASLVSMLGENNADRVMADAGWPALVATVESADPAQWTPETLLGTAYELLHAGTDTDLAGVEHVRPHELATALTWRADMLIRQHSAAQTYVAPTEEPLSPDDEEMLAPPEAEHTADGEHTAADVEVATPRRPADVAESVVGELPVVDDDYLASLDALDPGDDHDTAPPEHDSTAAELDAPMIDTDTADVPYGDPPGVEAWILAYADQHPQAPLQYPAATPAERVMLLRADLDDAQKDVRRLRTELLYDTGPAVTAVTPKLIELRNTADRQRPALIAMNDARAEWITAQLAVEDAEKYVATVRAELATAHTAGDTDRADTLDRTIEWERWRVRVLTEAADEARAVADDATTAYEQMGIADGGHVTPHDVEYARHAAGEIDLIALAAARDRVSTLEGQLFRAELTVTRDHAHTTVRLDDLRGDKPAASLDMRRIDPGAQRGGAANISVAELPTENAIEPAAADREIEPQVAVDQLADLRTVMRAHPIRLRTDGELARTVARIRAWRQQDALVPHRERVPAVDAVRTEQARLSKQAAAIELAHAAAAADSQARLDVAAAEAHLAGVHDTLDSAKRRDRPALTERLADADVQVRTAQHARAVTHQAARDAVARVGVPEHQWEGIVERASDHTALHSAVEAAVEADRAYEATTAELTARADAQRRELELARGEQQRRSELTPAERDGEDRIRAEERPITDPETAPPQSPAIPPHQVGPDPGLDQDRGYDAEM